MRKTVTIAVAAAVALATAAVAMAAVFTASGVSPTTATFSTDKVAKLKARTCTGADAKAFTLTDGHYTGVADFTNPATDLDGTLTIHAKTTYSTTDGFGWVEGSFRIHDHPTNLSGKFSGTLKGTDLVGFLTATSRGHHARVLGNLSATFNPATGFTGGALGSTSSTGVLAVIAGPVCKPPKPAPKPKPARPVSVHGVVSVVGDSSVGSTITVMSKGPSTATCTRDATSPATTGFAVGAKVEMKCELVGSTWTLRQLHAQH
jgi:hypothetical protein